MRLTWALLLLVEPSLASLASPPAWGVWPLYTPLLGNISSQCLNASQEYVANTQEALQTIATGGQLSDKHRAALAMFDAGGALPFLQEGHLSDSLSVDFCDLLAPDEADNEGCKAQVPAVIRILNIPFGAVTGPGIESQCRQYQGKYCYNYFQAFPPVSPALSLKPHLHTVNFPAAVSLALRQHQGSMFSWNSSASVVPAPTPATGDPGPQTQLLELLMTRSSQMKRIHRQILQFLERSGLGQQSAVLEVLGLILLLWATVNQSAGVGEWGRQAPLPYQAMCYPRACSKLDIQTNNIEFYQMFAVPGLPMVASSPLISDFLAELAGIDEEMAAKFRATSVGCSDDYSDHWAPESFAMLAVLVIIAVCILLGTVVDFFQANYHKPVVDTRENRPPGLAADIIISFSLIQNIKFILGRPSGSSQRLSCLEGMRSLSMTW